MWDWMVCYMDWDLHWLVLLSSLSKRTYLESGPQWAEMAPRIFSHILHIIDLPVGASRLHIYDGRDSSIPAGDGYPHYSLSIFVTKGSKAKVLYVVSKAAKLIVHMLPPGGVNMYTYMSIYIYIYTICIYLYI